MGRLLNPLLVQHKLKTARLKVFTLSEFCQLFGVSIISAKKFTEEYTKRKMFIRLKPGLFVLADNLPDQFFIANKLYEPSYISFDTMLSYYGIIPESIYPVTSVTTKATHEFYVENVQYTYRKIKKEAFTGYYPAQTADGTVFLAEPEKALADYLYFVSLNKRQLEYERLDLTKIKKNKLLSYLKLFDRTNLLILVEEIYAD